MTARSTPRTSTAQIRPALRRGASLAAIAALAAVAIAPGVEADATATPVTSQAALAAPATSQAAMAAPTQIVPIAADRSGAAQRASRGMTARQVLATRQARFTDFTLNSAATKDMRGVEPSLYRGAYFKAKAEEKRLCIVTRESEGEYDVINPTGSYFGAYQVSKPLARGVTFMMLPEHKKLMGTTKAKRVLSQLRDKPMNTWPRYWQDAAFHTIINWEGTLSGASHWAGGRWHC